MFCVLVEQVDEKDDTEVSGWVQRSFASSPQVYSDTVMGASVGSVTQRAKFTLPSPSVSNKLQASRVLLPVTLISSQFHETRRVAGSPASSTQSCVRSFWPGSSFAPAVSGEQVNTRTARAFENTSTATPTARRHAIAIGSIKRERDLGIVFIRARNG